MCVSALLGLSVGLPGCRRDADSSGASEKDGTTSRSTGPIFTDIAAEVGLRFDHFTGASGEYFFPEIMGSGCALFDYDNDGDLDVYLVQGSLLGSGKTRAEAMFPWAGPWPPSNRLFRNDLSIDARGTRRLVFVDVTAAAGVGDTHFGMGCAVGDYDNDGFLDLYVTNFSRNILYQNNGDGTFRDVSAAAGVDDRRWASSAAFLDYDQDGYLDLFVANYVDASEANNPICDPFGYRDYCDPSAFKPVMDVLYHNNGDGTFEDVTRRAGMDRAFGSGLGVVAADFDGDGWTDIYVANDGNNNQLWINQGDGTFKDVGLSSGTAVNAYGQPEAGMGVAVSDPDLDGDMDIFVTHLNRQTNTLYRNNGAGLFEDVTFELGLGFPSRPSTGFGTAWFDYDNDGFEDIFCANGAVVQEDVAGDSTYPYAQKNQLFHNEGGRGYIDAGDSAGPVMSLLEVSRGAAFGDVDNDGDVDILVSNNNGPIRLLRNEVGVANHWLSVAPRGVNGRRYAVGTRVTVVRADGTRMIKHVTSAGSYCSASDLRVHFGLG